MIKILPSLASANQLRLEEEIQKVSFIGHLHFDVEDGNFVPNITFGMKTIKSACSVLKNVCCDAHLMVINPMEYLEGLADLGFLAAAFHWEAAAYPMRLINCIQNLGMKAGIALNPRTPASEILDYLDQADYILLMSSEPDGAGEVFQEKVLDKITLLRKTNPSIDIIVDGGVTENNFQWVVQRGASGVVLGRAIFHAGDPEYLINRLTGKE